MSAEARDQGPEPAELQQQITEHANWQMHVDTTGTKPSEHGLTAEDIAYNMWLEGNAAEDHNGLSLRQLVKAETAADETAARREKLRDLARMSMRVKTGLATGEEAAYYYTQKEMAEAARAKVAVSTPAEKPEPKPSDKPKASEKPAAKPAKAETSTPEPTPQPTEPKRPAKMAAKATPSTPVPHSKPRATTKMAAAQPKAPRKAEAEVKEPAPEATNRELLGAQYRQLKQEQKGRLGNLRQSASDLRTRFFGVPDTAGLDASEPKPRGLKHRTKRTVENYRAHKRANGSLSIFEGSEHPEEQAEIHPEKPASAERDRSPYAEVGYRQEPAAYRSNPERSKYGTPIEDAVLVDNERALWGVFDGVGGEANPDAASKAAADAIWLTLEKMDIDLTKQEALEAMRYAFERARDYVASSGEGGATTAAVVKLVDIEGQRYALIGNAGDSRILMDATVPPAEAAAHSKPDELFELVVDQSRGKYLFNAMQNSTDTSQDEFKLIPVEAGQRIIICSDGITGDTPEQFLTYEEIKQAFETNRHPYAVARYLNAVSRKDDDKSVIVIDIK